MANKVYEYFRSEPIILSGKFARYADAMWKQGMIQESKFERLLDLYCIASMTGLMTENRLPDDKSDDLKRTIQVEQLTRDYTRLITLLRTVILVDQSRGYDVKKKAMIAFDENPKSEEDYRENMELFHSYARGGLEFMYNRLVLRTLDLDDQFSEAKIANIIEFAKNPVARDDDL